MPDTTFIYGLLEPDTGKLRYVGKANNPGSRLLFHLRDQTPSRKKNWISSLQKRGMLPTLQLLLEVQKADWQFWERDTISCFRESGYDLVNGTTGGDGTEGHRHSARAKERISKARIGNQANQGRTFSKEHKQKISLANVGRIFSAEHKKKLSESSRWHKV